MKLEVKRDLRASLYDFGTIFISADNVTNRQGFLFILYGQPSGSSRTGRTRSVDERCEVR